MRRSLKRHPIFWDEFARLQCVPCGRNTHMKSSRRAFLGASIGVAAASRGMPAIAQDAPLRIGCITTLSGAASILGKPQSLGMMLAAKKINETGGIKGRNVEIVVR